MESALVPYASSALSNLLGQQATSAVAPLATKAVTDAASASLGKLLGSQAPKISQGAQDLIDTLKGVGAKVDNMRNVSVFHRTTPENAKKIYETGQMFGKENDGGLFFSTNRDAQPGYGQGVVEAKIPAGKLVLDDIFDNNADVKFVVGKPNQMEDMSQYLVQPRQNLDLFRGQTGVDDLYYNSVGKNMAATRDIGQPFFMTPDEQTAKGFGADVVSLSLSPEQQDKFVLSSGQQQDIQRAAEDIVNNRPDVMAKLWGLEPDEADMLEGISLGRPQDIAKYTGKPVLENNADDIAEHFVYKGVNDEFDQLVPANLKARVKSYMPAEKLGSNLVEAANNLDNYKIGNRPNALESIDYYDSSNFDYNALVKKGEKELEKTLGKNNLQNLREKVSGTLKNLNKNYDADKAKTVAFLKSSESDDVVKLSKRLLPPGTKVWRGGVKDDINYSISKSVAESYGDATPYILKKTDRYIAPQITSIFHDGIDPEYVVLLLKS